MFVESSSAVSNQSGATFSATRGAAVNGDLILSFQETYLGGGAAPATPTGFTLLTRVAFGGTSDLAVFYRTMNGDGTSYTFNNSAGGLSPTANVWTIVIFGALTTPENSTTNTGSSTTATATGVTTINNGDLIFGAFAISGTAVTLTPNGFDGDYGTIAGTDKLDLASLTQASNGPTGDKTCTLSGGGAAWAAILVAISPTGGNVPPPGGGSGNLPFGGGIDPKTMQFMQRRFRRGRRYSTRP